MICLSGLVYSSRREFGGEGLRDSLSFFPSPQSFFEVACAFLDVRRVIARFAGGVEFLSKLFFTVKDDGQGLNMLGSCSRRSCKSLGL